MIYGSFSNAWNWGGWLPKAGGQVITVAPSTHHVREAPCICASAGLYTHLSLFEIFPAAPQTADEHFYVDSQDYIIYM